MNTAQKLKRVRLSLGLERTDFGDSFGVNVSAVGHWETGRNGFPKGKKKILYEKYNVNPRWFESEDDETDEPMFRIERPTPFRRKSPKELAEEAGLEGLVADLFTIVANLPPEKQELINQAVSVVFEAYSESKSNVSNASKRRVERPVSDSSINVGDVNAGDNLHIGNIYEK